MNKTDNNRNYFSILIISLIIILTSNVLSCNLISPLVFKAVRFPIVASLVILILIKKDRLNKQYLLFGKDIKWLMIIPCFSWVSALIVWGQGVVGSMVACTYLYILLLYYYCFAYKVSIRSIVKIFSVFTIIVFAIQIYDQFLSSPPFLFGGKEGEFGWVKRGLVYRISILINISTFVLFYYFEKLVKGVDKYTSVMFVVIGLMLTYFSCTRQVIIATIVSLLYMSFVNLKHKRTLVILGGIVAFLIVYGDYLFESLLELSSRQAEDGSLGDRNNSYAFYWDKIINDPMIFILGSGNAYGGAYERTMLNWTSIKEYIIVDIGHIGHFFLYGIGYIIVFFYLQYKLLIKCRKYLPHYIIAYLLFINIIGFMVAPLADMQRVCSFALIMYIADRIIVERQQGIITRDRIL